jgi:hypothetical protein
MPDVLTACRTHLIDLGLVRDPRQAGDAPPMWLHPRNGVPAPGEGENAIEVGPTLVTALFRSGGIPSKPYESFMRQPTVDLRIRSKTAPDATDLEAQIRAALVDQRNWLMGGLRVIDCEEWRALAPLGSDQQGFDWVASYLFQLYGP